MSSELNGFVSDTETYWKHLELAANYVREHLGEADIAFVLGSGLSTFDEILENRKSVSFSDVPFMPVPNVPGHSGRLSLGDIGPNKILCFAGRVHAYENYHRFQLCFQARLASLLKCKVFVVTNAAGGYIKGIKPGDAMVMQDHVNYHFSCPIGDVCADPRFGLVENLRPDQFYSARIADIARTAAAEIGMNLHSGVYTFSTGPAYETHSEVNSLLDCCAQAFGMSTVPEVVAAKAMGMEVFALSIITNLAAGKGDSTLDHEEVQEVARAASGNLRKLFVKVLSRIEPSPVTDGPPVSGKSVPISAPMSTPTDSDIRLFADDLKNKILSPYKIDTILVTSSEIWPDLPLTVIPDVSYTLPPSIFLGPTATPVTFGVGHFGNNLNVCVLDFPINYFVADRAVLAVVAIAHNAGISKMISLVDAYNALDGVTPAGTAVISDVVDQLSPFGSEHNFERNISGVFTEGKLTLEGLKSISYMKFAGPLMPTPAERKLAHDAAKVETVGVCGVSHVIAMAALNHTTLTLALPRSLPDSTIDLLNSITSQFSKISPAEGAAKISDFASFPTASLGLTRSHSLQHAPNDGRPLTVGECDDLKAKISYHFKDFPAPSAALFVDCRVEIPSGIFIELAALDIAEALNLVLSEGSKLRLSMGTWRGKGVYLLRYSHAHSLHVITPKQSRDMTVCIRALRGLNVNRLISLVPVTDVAGVAASGDVIIAEDHINFIGSSPLFGHNDEAFGPRFPDMAAPYDSTLRAKLAACKVKHTNGCFLLLSNVLASKSEKQLGSTFGAKAICDAGVHLAITAAHCKLPMALIGINIAKSSKLDETWAAGGLECVSVLVEN